MILDAQAQFDQETAHHTRQTLKKLAAKVRTAQDLEAVRKGEAREARKAARQAHEQLTAAIEGDSDADDLAYVRHVQGLTTTAESAREEETAARQRWVAAVVARRKAQDELRVAVRRHMQPLPLFDRQSEPAANGHAEEPQKESPAPEGEPWPGGLTEKIVRRAYIAPALAAGPKKSKKGEVLPVKVNPYEDARRLWVVTGYQDSRTIRVLPLYLASDFFRLFQREGWSERLTVGDVELADPREYYTGVVVRVGNKRYAIAPAGEGKTLVKPKE